MSICMCSTLFDCGKKNECYRFRKEPHEFWQPWADMYKAKYDSSFYGDTFNYNAYTCANFIPIKKGDILRK